MALSSCSLMKERASDKLRHLRLDVDPTYLMNAAPTTQHDTAQHRCARSSANQPHAHQPSEERSAVVVGKLGTLWGTLCSNAHSATDGRALLVIFLFYHATASSSIGSIGSIGRSSSSSGRGRRRRSRPVCVYMCLYVGVSSHPTLAITPPSDRQQAARNRAHPTTSHIPWHRRRR